MKLPQLTLRDLFWLVVVSALAIGWWLEYRRRDPLQPDLLWQMAVRYGNADLQEAVLDLAIEHHPDEQVRERLAEGREHFLESARREARAWRYGHDPTARPSDE
jgi:hypothetical protein